MAIQNIQGLVDKQGLSYINNNNFLINYYNEALANLGQRNTNDSLLENVIFSITNIFDTINQHKTIKNPDINWYVIYHDGNFYTLKSSVIISDNVDQIKEIISDIQVKGFNSEYLTNQLNTELDNLNDSALAIINKQINIIDSLYELIKSNSNNGFLFIPSNYLFGYIANGINKVIIYNSFKDIYVNVITNNFISLEDDYELENINLYTNNLFYFADQKFIKTDVYDYYFQIVNGEEEIQCNHKFTLPYIDNDDNWVINDQSTSIQAKAHDAVNLNIILAYYDKSNYEFLSGINNNLNPDTIEISQTPTSFILKNGDNGYIQCSINLPIITTNNISKRVIELNTLLQNSLLIIISKISNIVDENTLDSSVNLEKYGENGEGYVTTIWKYETSDDYNGFKCLTIDNEKYALDFNILTNFENLLKYEIKNLKQVEPDNFLFSHLVFDQIYQQLKQDTSTTIYSYPVLQNIKGFEYNNKYSNNMNFSLKYVNHINGESGNILDISKESDTKFLKTSNIGISNGVTNSLYQYIENNKVNYYSEYLPNYNIPLFDFSEILVKDINSINKYNIISFDYDGKMYYSYIGTSFNTDKDTLTIGSSNLNINLGEKTLSDYNTKKSFKVQDKLNIDFAYTYINGDLKVSKDINVQKVNINEFEWKISKLDGNEVRTTTIVPQFKYYRFDNNNQYKEIDISNLENQLKNLSNNLGFGTKEKKDYLYINILLKLRNTSNDLIYYYKHGDLLVLPNLIKYLGIEKEITTFESNTNDIIYINGSPLYLVSSNNQLSDSLMILNSADTSIKIETSNIKPFYIGNILYISYIPSQNKLIINEVQSNKIKSIWKLPTNIN